MVQGGLEKFLSHHQQGARDDRAKCPAVQAGTLQREHRTLAAVSDRRPTCPPQGFCKRADPPRPAAGLKVAADPQDFSDLQQMRTAAATAHPPPPQPLTASCSSQDTSQHHLQTLHRWIWVGTLAGLHVGTLKRRHWLFSCLFFLCLSALVPSSSLSPSAPQPLCPFAPLPLCPSAPSSKTSAAGAVEQT